MSKKRPDTVEVRTKVATSTRRDFYAACVRAGKSMTEVLERFMEEYIKKSENKS